MRAATFNSDYWMKADLVTFARQLGVATQGKPELTQRIVRRLRGLPHIVRSEGRRARRRDSERPIRGDTPVVNYWSDAKTRACFVAQIGHAFHFTYRLNQHRIAHDHLTYGDLVDEWLAEHRRQNRGRSRTIARLWNAIKCKRGNPAYRRPKRPR